MNYSIRNIALILVLLSFTGPMGIKAQEKIDVNFELGDGKVFIFYFLHGNADKEYEINAVLRKSGDPSFKLVPKEMTGDVGEGKFADKKCTIIWHISKDEEASLEGEDFYFEVTAGEVSESSSSWYWYALGAVVAGGGAATYLLLNKNKDTKGPVTESFAVPPGRP
ncbi:MAG: hypothetical protein ACM3S2_12700 [Ignavibacteriales bacterium]